MRKLKLIFIVAAVTCVALIRASSSLADSYTLTLIPQGPLTVGQPFVIQAGGTNTPSIDGLPNPVYLDVDIFSPAVVSTCPLNVEASEQLAAGTGGSSLAFLEVEQEDDLGNFSNPVGGTPTAPGPILVCGYTSQTGVTLASATLSLTVAPAAPAPAPTPAPGPTPTPTPPLTPPATNPVPTVDIGTVSGANGRLSVKLSCPAGGADCATATVRATVTEHLTVKKLIAVTGRTSDKRVRTTSKKVVIASGSASLKAAATKTITLKLDATGRKLLAKYGKLTAIVTIKSGGKIRKTITIHIQGEHRN